MYGSLIPLNWNYSSQLLFHRISSRSRYCITHFESINQIRPQLNCDKKTIACCFHWWTDRLENTFHFCPCWMRTIFSNFGNWSTWKTCMTCPQHIHLSPDRMEFCFTHFSVSHGIDSNSFVLLSEWSMNQKYKFCSNYSRCAVKTE